MRSCLCVSLAFAMSAGCSANDDSLHEDSNSNQGGNPQVAQTLGTASVSASETESLLNSTSGEGGNGTESLQPVDITFVVHLEGHDSGDSEEFTGYVERIRNMMDVFEAHGAKLSFETESVVTGNGASAKESLVQGIQMFGDNIFEDAIARGHDVQLHGGLMLGLEATLEQFEEDLVEQTALLNEVGVYPISVSNTCSALDWVQALSDTGFLFSTSIIEYCAKSLPEDLQSESTKACEAPNECHAEYPFELDKRLHPWRAGTPDWTTTDPEGLLVIMPQTYNFTCVAEQSTEPGSYLTCDITEDDIPAYLDLVEYALTVRSQDQVTAIIANWSFGGHPTEGEMPIVEDWLEQLEPYAADGLIRFTTTTEVYDEYTALEAKL